MTHELWKAFHEEAEKTLEELAKKGREIGFLLDNQSINAELQIKRGKDVVYTLRSAIYPDCLTLDQATPVLQLSPRTLRVTSRKWLEGFLKSSRSKESQRLAVKLAKVNLYKEGYLTLGEIKALGAAFFESFPNCGFVTVISLGEILDNYGLISLNSHRRW